MVNANGRQLWFQHVDCAQITKVGSDPEEEIYNQAAAAYLEGKASNVSGENDLEEEEENFSDASDNLTTTE